MRYLMTHSLLGAWLWLITPSRFESAERDDLSEFLQTLKREPTETTDAMQAGIDFENAVTDIINGEKPSDYKFLACAEEAALILKGASLQCRAKKRITIDGIDLLLYGKLDGLKGGVIYDTKCVKSYDIGKYQDSTQHPMYFEIVPEALQFSYIVCDRSHGGSIAVETYLRDETVDVKEIIRQFLNWLNEHELFEIYAGHWQCRDD